MKNLRNCPHCGSRDYKTIFAFDYDYLMNIEKMDEKQGYKKDKKFQGFNREGNIQEDKQKR